MKVLNIAIPRYGYLLGLLIGATYYSYWLQRDQTALSPAFSLEGELYQSQAACDGLT